MVVTLTTTTVRCAADSAHIAQREAHRVALLLKTVPHPTVSQKSEVAQSPRVAVTPSVRCADNGAALALTKLKQTLKRTAS